MDVVLEALQRDRVRGQQPCGGCEEGLAHKAEEAELDLGEFVSLPVAVRRDWQPRRAFCRAHRVDRQPRAAQSVGMHLAERRVHAGRRRVGPHGS